MNNNNNNNTNNAQHKTPGIPGIVIDSTPQEIEALQKKCNTMNKLFKFFLSTALVDILTPFDFDGFLIELVSSTIACVFLISGKINEHKLQELKKQYANSQNQSNYNTHDSR